jgi:hypothetical protein
MKRIFLLTVLCVISALAITFIACNKETEEGTKNISKSGTLADKGIYECLDPGVYSLSEGAVKSHGCVVQRTTFVNGDVWVGQKADIYKISITKGGTEYSSFCGAYISNAFGESVEYSSAALVPAKKAQIISAFNYIYDNYGSLNGWMEDDYNDPDRLPVSPENSTYVVGQCVIWMILDYIDETGNLVQPQNGIVSIYPEYSNPGYYDYGPYINRGFEAVIDAAYAAATSGYTGSKTVTDIAYLTGPNYPADISGWQPQIIPLGGTPEMGPSVGTVTATNAGNVPLIKASLNPKNGNAMWDAKNPFDPTKTTQFVVPNSNHFVFAKATSAELEEGVNLEFLVGNKYDVVGTGSVKLVDGNLELTIDKYAQGSFGLIAFNQLPITNNGNIHSQKEADLKKIGAVAGFNHDNKVVVPCPAGDVIYIYFHSGAMNFWL